MLTIDHERTTVRSAWPALTGLSATCTVAGGLSVAFRGVAGEYAVPLVAKR